MRWLALGLVALVAIVGACANSASPSSDSGAPPSDAHVNVDVLTIPIDTGASDASLDVFDAGCDPDCALGGIGLPAGTTATATTSYQTSTPDLAVDGDPSTYWNAGDVTGSLTITFPSPQTFDAIRIEAIALPISNETYAITGFQDAVPIAIGQSTQSVPQGSTVLAPIGVTIGTYDAIEIDVTSDASWVAIGEVALVTQACP